MALIFKLRKEQIKDELESEIGDVIYKDANFPGVISTSSLYKACDGSIINDIDSPFYGQRIRNLNGEDVVLSVTWTADPAGAYATIPLTDVTALNVGDWVTGSGIAADTMIEAINEDTGIISITDISASGSISTTFNNEGIFIAGGSNTKQSGRDEFQGHCFQTTFNAVSAGAPGAYWGIAHSAPYYSSYTRTTNTPPIDDSTNGTPRINKRTKTHHRRLKAFMKIKMA